MEAKARAPQTSRADWGTSVKGKIRGEKMKNSQEKLRLTQI